MKVLYVDSKKTWHLFFEKILSTRGMEVLHAYTFKEALNLINTEKPDAVIFNYKISGMPVTEILPDVKATGVPFIVIGYKEEGMNPEALKEAGAFEVLEKPFTVEDLIAVLKSLKEKLPEVKKEEIEMEVVGAGGEPLPVVDLDEIEVTPVTEEPTLEIKPEEAESGIEVEEIKAPTVSEQPEELIPVKEVTEEKQEEAVVSEPAAVESVVPETTEKVKEQLPASISSLDEKLVEKVVREVAWEVVPELAEKIIREEIRKLIQSRLA